MSSGLPSRKAVALTLAVAVAAGTVAGLALVALAPTGGSLPPPPRSVPATPAAKDPSGAPPSPRPPDAEPAPIPSPGPPAEPAEGIEERISDPDEEVRFAAALDLLEDRSRGLARARAMHATSEEGRALLAKVVLALDRVARTERSARFARLPEDSRQEVWLTAALEVLPERLLAEHRREFWEARIETDALRLTRGRIGPAEADLAVLELARVRLELGEIPAEDYSALRNEKIGGIRTWIAQMRDRRDLPAARKQALADQLERIER